MINKLNNSLTVLFIYFLFCFHQFWINPFNYDKWSQLRRIALLWCVTFNRWMDHSLLRFLLVLTKLYARWLKVNWGLRQFQWESAALFALAPGHYPNDDDDAMLSPCFSTWFIILGPFICSGPTTTKSNWAINNDMVIFEMERGPFFGEIMGINLDLKGNSCGRVLWLTNQTELNLIELIEWVRFCNTPEGGSLIIRNRSLFAVDAHVCGLVGMVSETVNCCKWSIQGERWEK